MASGGTQSERPLDNVQDAISCLECDILLNERETSKVQASLSTDEERLSKIMSSAEPNLKFAQILRSDISQNKSAIEDLQRRLHKLQDELSRLQDSDQSASSRPSPPPTTVVPLQPVEEPKSFHQNVDEKNWRTAGTLIFHACDQARQFAKDSFCALHKSILNHIDATFVTATASGERHFSQAEFLRDFEGYQNCIRQKFALHVIDCHDSFARGTQQNLNRVRSVNDQVSYEEFLDPSGRIRIAWRNSDTKFWIDSMLGPFEMAKLFCKSFGSFSPPLGFGDLEPGSLFRMLARCTFFTLPWMNTGQLLRPRTLKGCLWSYKRWKAAYSSCALDSDDLSRIRSLLSNFIQEISVAKSDLANLASIEEYFDVASDSFAGASAVSLSIGTSQHGGSEHDVVSCAGSNSDRQESYLSDFNFDEVYSSIMAHARDSVDFVHRKLEDQSGTQSNTLQLSIQEFVKLNLIEAYLLVQVSHIHRILHSPANLFFNSLFLPFSLLLFWRK
jgi:hypothetical protein